MARGNRRRALFLRGLDFDRFLSMLDELARRRRWIGNSYCLLPNHYHLVVETPAADLSRGMQWLNGRYAQAFNRIHGFDGHLFQGRFTSLLVESDRHLLELGRYLALNPVRAGLSGRPEDWTWSSYRAHVGLEAPRRFLAPDGMLSLFGRSRERARERFADFVHDVPARRPA